MAVVLKEIYEEEVVPFFAKELGYENKLAVPKINKVILNMGIGEGSRNQAIIDKHLQELTNIAGQKAVVTKAKKSISNFKIRQGMPVGVKVTLRGERMYNFLYKLFNIVLPKVRDFRGVSPSSFDGRGNFSMGLSEQAIFPEVCGENVRTQGMVIVKEARYLLEKLGMPFSRNS
jgi:large subunit ribosomal protein L5